MQDPSFPEIQDRLQHIATQQFGDVYAVDPVSAQTPGDQIISVKFLDGSSVNARASEFMLLTRKKDRTFGAPSLGNVPPNQRWIE
jgi:hypothetical protein